MTKRKEAKITKKKIVLMAILIAVALSLLTFIFIKDVKTQLWQQSVNNLMETIKSGSNTLRLQLNHDYTSMEVIAEQIKTISIDETKQLSDILSYYRKLESSASLYLEDGSCIPSKKNKDEEAEKILLKTDKKQGIINPHISTATGVNVFNLFMEVTLQDKTKGYLVREYEINNIVDNFSLSFYNDAGFSYVINTKGDVLIRPPHPNSNKTVKNLFDMLPASQNDSAILKQFSKALEELSTGWAVFTYGKKEMFFCYTPIIQQSDWILIAIIPKTAINAQTNEILMQSILLIIHIIIGISLFMLFYIWYATKTQKKLRNQADYIEHLYNAIPDAVALITVEYPYQLLQINQEGLRLLGYEEDTSNKAIEKVLIGEIVHPDDYEKMIKLFQDISIKNKKEVLESRLLKKDGSFFWITSIIEKSYDENGNPVLIAAFHDITAEKIKEEEAEREKLQERLTLVKAISNAYPVIISLNLTKDTINFIYIQPGLIPNLGKQKSYTELFEEIKATIHYDNIEEFKSRFERENLKDILSQDKKEVFLEAKQRLMDGEYHWLSTQIIYTDNPYSEDKLAILISRCIDDQRYEEEQQRQMLQSALDNANAANRAKSQFLSNMSHDIRTPMNAIVGMTAIAATHLEDSERTMECLKKISLASKHLLSLINDILDMSRIESGKLSLTKEPFNFAELTTETIDLIRAQAKEKELKLDIHLRMLKNENVIGDPLRIRQIFINILSNAVKYTLPKGKIHVEVKQENSARKGYQSYIFRCSDTGLGMSKEFLKRLFQPFERANDYKVNKVGGTGLGMAIIKNLIDIMNGDILVESELEVGSVFTVTLPLQLQEEEQEELSEEWIGIRSLIVDDNQQICKNASELLKNMGLRAEFVMQGQQAVKYILEAKNTSDPFSLVLVDWQMPDMNGIEVVRNIRKQIGPDVLVIILTAYDWSEIEGDATEAGVTAFLSKPIYRSKICYLFNEIKKNNELKEQKSLKIKPNYNGKHLLLVEDNEINREIAKELIGNEIDIEIEEACDGLEAVKKFSESKEGYYNLVLMDIQMPKMDGYEATKMIRALQRQDAKTIPIIAMTANAFEEDAREALRAGMNAHFTKPIEIESLRNMLIQYLSETI